MDLRILASNRINYSCKINSHLNHLNHPSMIKMILQPLELFFSTTSRIIFTLQNLTTKVATQKLCQRLVIGQNGLYLCHKKYPLTSIIHNLDINQLQQFPCSLYTKILFCRTMCRNIMQKLELHVEQQTILNSLQKYKLLEKAAPLSMN